MKAYKTVLADDGLNGEAIELEADKLYFSPFPEYLAGKVSRRACALYEPFFEYFHHERSGLPDAI